MRFAAIALVWLATSAFVQTFDAKVVGVSDGDTITVYDDREQTNSVRGIWKRNSRAEKGWRAWPL